MTDSLTFLEAQGALRGLAIRRDLAPSVPRVRADQHALEQVIVNLVLNARDAAPGARITVGTRPELYEPDLRARPREPEGPVPPRTWLDASFSAKYQWPERAAVKLEISPETQTSG